MEFQSCIRSCEITRYCTNPVPVTGCNYEGEWFEKMNCAVSILRSGEFVRGDVHGEGMLTYD